MKLNFYVFKLSSFILIALFGISAFAASPQHQSRPSNRTQGVVGGPLLITEIMTGDNSNLADEDGEFSDWIELFNAGLQSVNLKGWSLTDESANLKKWVFPERVLQPGDYLVLFASGKNRINPNFKLHTNFRLSAEGEFLALVQPDGVTLSHAYTPFYPSQVTPAKGVSFGLPNEVKDVIDTGAMAKIWVPTDDSLGQTWASTFFDDSFWSTTATGTGYGSESGTFTVTTIESNVTIQSLEDADILIATPSFQKRKFIEKFNIVNFNDNNSEGNYAAGIPFPGHAANQDLDDFIILATTSIIIPVTDHWTFGINSDDGARLRINGKDVILDDTTHAPQDTFGTLQLTAGVHTLELLFFERGGGSGCELFAARGQQGAFNSNLFKLIGDTANGGLELEGFGSLIASNIEDLMKGKNASLYLRLPFNLSTISENLSLILKTTYNDGFVALINGYEVARRNAPVTLSWNSTAPVKRSSSETTVTERIALTLPDGLLKTGTNILAIQGLNFAADDHDFLIAPELTAISLSPDDERYFLNSTPGSPNIGGVIGFVEPPLITPEHGLYSDPIQVTLTPVTEGSEVRYTLDGSQPTDSNGTLYTGPISVSKSGMIRAAGFKKDFQPSPSITRTYIYLSDVLTQTRPAGYPTVWGGGVAGDYNMDTRVVNDPNYKGQMTEVLTSLPIISLVADPTDLFGSQRGIYTHPETKGDAWERAGSAELFYPNGVLPGFQINCGVQIQGGYSRSPANKKHSFRLLFKSIYGPEKLEYPFFPDSTVDEFDTLVLRGGFNYTWHGQEGGLDNPVGKGSGKSEYIRDQFSRSTQGDLGQPTVHGEYFHLYLNGLYWGLYNVTERPDASYGSAHFGGDKDEWDAISSGSRNINTTQVKDGNKIAWNTMISLAEKDLSIDANYKALQEYVDIDNLIDYMMVIIYTGNRDAPTIIGGGGTPWNFWSNRWRKLGAGTRFYAWDSEWALEEVTANAVNYHNGRDNPGRIFQKLRVNAEFRQRFADRVQKYFFNGGPLTPEASLTRYQKWVDRIDEAIIAESARWGDVRSSSPRTKDNSWLPEVNRLKNSYFPQRSAIVLNQLRIADLYPKLAAPEFNKPGGQVNSGFQLMMTGAAQDTTTTVPLISMEDSWRYNQSGTALSDTWRSNSYNETSWLSGNALLYVESAALPARKSTALTLGRTAYYFRKRFTVPTDFNLTNAKLKMQYIVDDGLVVYLNGQEIHRRGMPDGTPAYATFANRTVDNAVLEGPLELPATALRTGNNVIAVEVHQVNASSSDIVFGLSLEAVSISSTPVPNTVPIYYTTDGSDPRLYGGAINATGAKPYTDPVALTQDVHIKARAFDGSTWSALNEATFTVGSPADLQTLLKENLVISELMYNPADGGEYEFIELVNYSDVQTLNLSGLSFTEGIAYTFPEGAILQPGGFIALYNSTSSESFMRRRYNIPSKALLLGPYTGKLDNAGEKISLRTKEGSALISFEYSNKRGWPLSADGAGHSLESTVSAGNPNWLNYGNHWRISQLIGGSPGGEGRLNLPQIQINEIRSNTGNDNSNDPELTSNDWIELYNPENYPVTMKDYFLSDDPENLRKWVLPEITLQPNTLVVFDEQSGFNINGLGFGLNRKGESLYLSHLPVDATGYHYVSDAVGFKAQPSNESWSRVPDGSPYWFRTPESRGEANIAPIVEAVIDEIMFDPYLNSDQVDDNIPDEYIEIFNPNNQPLPLWNEQGSWRMDGGIDYIFPAGTTLPPKGRLLLVGFNPADQNAKSIFMSQYNMSSNAMTILGPYEGKLSNIGERLAIEKPFSVNQLGEPDAWVIVDEAIYFHDRPFTNTASNTGLSLQRISSILSGNNPTNWLGQLPTIGSGATDVSIWMMY